MCYCLLSTELNAVGTEQQQHERVFIANAWERQLESRDDGRTATSNQKSGVLLAAKHALEPSDEALGAIVGLLRSECQSL